MAEPHETHYAKLEDLSRPGGRPRLGTSDWIAVDQARIDQFAQATGDHQWIHRRPRARRGKGPFGAPIAHGFLTLSLLPLSWARPRSTVADVRMGVNYGLNKRALPEPGASWCGRVRGHFKLTGLGAAAPAARSWSRWR